jgi:hypothetical protein
MNLDPAAIRAALEADDSAELFDDLDFEGLDGSMIDEIVRLADQAGLFGDVQVEFWITADSEGIVDGGLITVDLSRRLDAVRIASLHQDFRDLVDDRNDTDWKLATGVVVEVGRIVDQLIGRYQVVQECIIHRHERDGQELVHAHLGGNRPHGYFDHPEDPEPRP